VRQRRRAWPPARPRCNLYVNVNARLRAAAGRKLDGLRQFQAQLEAKAARYRELLADPPAAGAQQAITAASATGTSSATRRPTSSAAPPISGGPSSPPT
jgi:hypothetical protein